MGRGGEGELFGWWDVQSVAPGVLAASACGASRAWEGCVASRCIGLELDNLLFIHEFMHRFHHYLFMNKPVLQLCGASLACRCARCQRMCGEAHQLYLTLLGCRGWCWTAPPWSSSPSTPSQTRPPQAWLFVELE